MEELKANATPTPTGEEPTLRPWTTPTFERTVLKDALGHTTTANTMADGTAHSS